MQGFKSLILLGVWCLDGIQVKCQLELTAYLNYGDCGGMVITSDCESEIEGSTPSGHILITTLGGYYGKRA